MCIHVNDYIKQIKVKDIENISELVFALRYLNTIFSWFYYIHYVWSLYIAASSKFAPGIAIKSLTAANGHRYCVNVILDDNMLQYCHVFMLPTFKAYTCQQYVSVLSAILSANGQTWLEYALTAVNSPMRPIMG